MEYIGAGIFIIVLIVRGFRWLLRQTNPTAPTQAPPPPAGFQPSGQFSASTPSTMRPQAPFFAPPPSQPSPVRDMQQAARLEQDRLMPRQPSAGGPAVPFETDRQDFERQEQDLFASEPSALGALLSSPPPPQPAAAPNILFNGTDDLIRAIILQEALKPPLSRRHSAPSSAPASHTPS